MVKAHLTLPDGTTVDIDGDPDEVHKLLQLYSGGSATGRGAAPRKTRKPKKAAKKSGSGMQRGKSDGPVVDLIGIVNHIKTCDQTDQIDKAILRKRDRVNRVLLPLYIVKEHMGDPYGLTSGDIKKALHELGVSLSHGNVSSALSGVAKKYVIGDKTRVSGVAVRYKLSIHGLPLIKKVIQGEGGDDAK